MKLLVLPQRKAESSGCGSAEGLCAGFAAASPIVLLHNARLAASGAASSYQMAPTCCGLKCDMKKCFLSGSVQHLCMAGGSRAFSKQ